MKKLNCPACGHHVANIESVNQRKVARDPIARFIAERVNIGPGAHFTSSEAYAAYLAWLPEGTDAESHVEFGRELRRAGIEAIRLAKGRRAWVGTLA